MFWSYDWPYTNCFFMTSGTLVGPSQGRRTRSVAVQATQKVCVNETCLPFSIWLFFILMYRQYFLPLFFENLYPKFAE